MRIKIVHEIEIDPMKWAETYGIESKPEEVKKDVQAHFEGVLEDHLESLGLTI